MFIMKVVTLWKGMLLLLLGASPAASQGWDAPLIPRRSGRLCVEEGTDCSRLQLVSEGKLSCVPVRDRLDCLKKIQAQTADVGYFEAEDLIVAGLYFNDNQQVMLEAFDDNEVQAVYVLVHNGSNTHPQSLCHPGLKLHLSYPRVLYRPITLPSGQFLPDIKAQIEKLSETWTSACIPGPWSLDPVTDQQLKQQHPHLCRSCLRQNCDADDPYAGSGALTCLLDHSADAAIVSDVDFRKMRNVNHEVERLYHYCRGNDDLVSIQPLGDLTRRAGEPCDWGKRPLPVFMFATICNTTNCSSGWQRPVKTALVTHANVVVETLGLSRTTQLTALNKPLTAFKFILEAGYLIWRTRVRDPVRFCVHSDEEMAKCRDLKMVAEALGVGIGLGIECVQGSSRCIQYLFFGKADVIALDSGDVYQVMNNLGFQRLLSEVYDTKSGRHTSSYYAVAVVKANSNITSFAHLHGLKSCHTGIGKTAGWKLPVATLLNLGLINPEDCDFVTAMAEFFSGGSCAPGARDRSYNRNMRSNYSDRLCSLCVGDGNNKCLRGSAEPFYSYTGAFRCLVHGGGDVAFIKHTTVPDNTDGANTDDWAVSLRSDDFKLLCPSHGGTAAVSEFRTCNLALVPAHEVVVSGRMMCDRKEAVRQVLLGVSVVFGEASPRHKTFRLFGKYHGKSDLLFKDSAKGLKDLSEDTPIERQRKKYYFKKLDELHSCEVNVCALEDYESECEAMAQAMKEEGQQFVCSVARDRMDCVLQVIRGQVDMTILPGDYLNINPDLRIIAYSRNPVYARERFRYRAVTVVRRSTVRSVHDLLGKKSCHTGYGRTAGWRIPVALLKRGGVIHPVCGANQSTLGHEIESVADTFHVACVPGEWATAPDDDATLKMLYGGMCSLCHSKTCDSNDDYAGYAGALHCLCFGGGDVAFSKLTAVEQFFVDNQGVNISEYGLMCQDGRIVGINSTAAKECFWAARPWDVYVTHASASEEKVSKLYWALIQAKWKGEKDLANSSWYFNTLGITDSFSDILPPMDNITTGQYLAESRMDTVLNEELCVSESPVRFCVSSFEEYRKCEDLATVLLLRGVVPKLQCTQGTSVDECIDMISLNTSDVMTLSLGKRITIQKNYSFTDLLSESYGGAETNLYYFVGVVKKSSGINSFYDLAGKTTCNAKPNSNVSSSIDDQLSDCLQGGDFFLTISDAMKCLMGSDKDVAFVKQVAYKEKNWEEDIKDLNPENFELICEADVKPIRNWYVEECNLGRIPSNTLVTRLSESRGRKENMRHLFLEASNKFGHYQSFFRLFYKYFSHEDLMFRDVTGSLVRVTDNHHEMFVEETLKYACNLYDHHMQSAEGRP